jgi:hypothetical protein
MKKLLIILKDNKKIKYMTQEEINIFEKTLNQLNQLIQRWIKAWGPTTGYSSGAITRIDFRNQIVYIHANPSCPGLGRQESMPLKYLLDDTNLERDAAEYYREVEAKRLAPYNRQRELENDPKVKEWRDIESRKNYIHYPIGGGSLISLV